MKKIAAIIAVFLLFYVSAFSADEAVKNSVVKIFTISNSPSFYQPWQMKGQVAGGGSGCIISGNRILTNAHVVSNVTFMQVKKFGDTERYIAKVLAIDHDVDLAILTVQDKKFFKGTSPLSFGNTPKQGDTVNVYGFPVGGEELSRTKGVVSRVEVSTYFHSYKSFLNMQIDAPLNSGNSGGPVIKDGRIAGVAFQNYNNAESIGYAIPTEIIRHFLSDLSDGKYTGFASLGIWWQTLENESAREMLGMTPKQSGILVIRSIYDTSAWNVLKDNDVILSINGVSIANDGTVPLSSDKNVKVKYSYLTDTKNVGEKVKMKIIRNKKPMDIIVTLKKGENFAPAVIYDEKPSYYIFGGMVFTKLTGNFLREWGEISKSPIHLASKYYYDFQTPEKQEVVVLIQVLADDINIGYHDNNYLAVESVNGAPVSSLADLAKKIEGNKDKYLTVTLYDNSRIILDYAKCRNTDPQILERYEIASPMSDDIAAVFAAAAIPEVNTKIKGDKK